MCHAAPATGRCLENSQTSRITCYSGLQFSTCANACRTWLSLFARLRAKSDLRTMSPHNSRPQRTTRAVGTPDMERLRRRAQESAPPRFSVPASRSRGKGRAGTTNSSDLARRRSNRHGRGAPEDPRDLALGVGLRRSFERLRVLRLGQPVWVSGERAQRGEWLTPRSHELRPRAGDPGARRPLPPRMPASGEQERYGRCASGVRPQGRSSGWALHLDRARLRPGGLD